MRIGPLISLNKMSFSGFSEDDIKRLQNNKKVIFENAKPRANNKRDTTTAKSQQQPTKTVKNSTRVNKSLPTDNNNISNDTEASVENKTEIIKSEINLISQDNTQQDTGRDGGECISKELKTLIEFDVRQRLIQEQNRRRKELLAKALADKTKQTQEEFQRLTEVEKEFTKLDAILSNDVNILRKQIDSASFEYMEAQKRYDRIEKEFLDAKYALFQKLEKKQMLTEHLCAIIQKNEERKAEKLNELLKKLNVDPLNDKDKEMISTNTPTEGAS